jgi:FkbM family methyltransferase
MKQTIKGYKPSWKNFNKYFIYLSYFKEYLKYGDFKSLSASLKYVLAHKLPNKEFTSSSAMGKFTIRKHTTDFQFINFAYEKDIKNYLLKNIDTFDVFIDVGACIGEYCVWLALKGKKCIAVEPVNFAGLKRNVALNSLEDKIQVYPVGVGNKKERVYFEILEFVTSSSHIERNSTKEPNVDIERLDDLFKKFGLTGNERVIMKLDVEGMEVEAIEGAKELISQIKDLRVIYEHFPADELKNDKALQRVCDFTFSDIDKVNRLAIKSAR